ncbi:MAG: hypothetical protein M3O31_00985 [Acidobacteriota bacterium]|nr:hypothetical protein [Acidobacteriota bacterium]
MKFVHVGLVVLAAFLAGIAVSASEKSVGSTDPLDAVNAAPKNHRVLYEDDHVRVIEVTVQPGETENLHIHRLASVFIYDAAQPRIKNHLASGAEWEYGRNFEVNSKTIEGIKLPSDVSAAMAQRQADLPRALESGRPSALPMGPDRGGAHQVTNLDTFPHHFYRFEFKHLDGNSIMQRTSY